MEQLSIKKDGRKQSKVSFKLQLSLFYVHSFLQAGTKVEPDQLGSLI